MARWLELESVHIFCQLEKGHAGEHWSGYQYEGDENPSGEVWWVNFEDVYKRK